jgi:hypothetical protein
MDESTILLIDDVHLEHRDLIMQESFADYLKSKIQIVKNELKNPILVCAGDIDEGIKGIEWLKQFECDIVYVCGNHEFWNNDYYEVIKSLEDISKQSEYAHIRFLHNKAVYIEGIRFIGGTLWTDFLKDFKWLKNNQIIENYTSMADFKKIKAQQFYEDENNVKDLINLLHLHEVKSEKIQDLIENKMFNPLIQLRENDKTFNFIEKELSSPFNGTTVVVTHHLPILDLWIKRLKMNKELLSVENINNKDVFNSFINKRVKPSKNILMMGFYANDYQEKILKKYPPDYWFHGHFHQPVLGFYGKTLVCSSPVGHFKENDEKSIEQNIRVKEIKLNKKDKLEMIQQYNENEIEKLCIEKISKNLENVISSCYIMSNSGLISSLDLKDILDALNVDFNRNLVEIKNRMTECINLVLLHKDQPIHLDDYFLIRENSGFNKWLKDNNQEELMFLNPFNVNEKSFLDSGVENEDNYIVWLKELEKIRVSLKNYKKNMIDFLKLN